jgi:hypothetical protein
MELIWYERNQEAVVEALQGGRQPEMVTTMSSGPLDELVALHDELGIFSALGKVEVQRERQGLSDALLLRTLATLPFLAEHSFQRATGQLFREPAILLHLGWSAFQIQMGDNERHRGPDGRSSLSLPCNRETLRGELGRIDEAQWLQVQRAGVQELYRRNLVRGHVYAIDGTGLGDGLRLVCLVCVSAERPKIVAWRLLEGDASEKGKEAAVTRCLIEQAIELGSEGAIELLLVDALYADGPLLAWCKYEHQIDVLVPLPSDREIHRDLLDLKGAGALSFQRRRYVRTIQGHKQRRTLDLGAQSGLTGWDSYRGAARRYGDEDAKLWGCLVVPVDPTSEDDVPWTLVSTRTWVSGLAAYEGFRPRWHIENDAYRELKEGWGLEAQRWSRDVIVQRGRVALTCLAFNTAQVFLSRSGEKLTRHGIRHLRYEYFWKLGPSPAVVYIGRYYAVFPVEELLRLLGHHTRRSLAPRLRSLKPP